jgi:metal-responsive CopG/Arc/MetJ family transcriptional regulator
MIGRMDHPKAKVSITLAADLVEAVDRVVKQEGTSRSAVIEGWLRRASRQAAEERIRLDTVAYYEGLSASDRAEDARIARATSRSARRLRIDD